MKKVTVDIYDDWYYSILAEYEAAKEMLLRNQLSVPEPEEFICQFLFNMLNRDSNDAYMEIYYQKHYAYLCAHAPGFAERVDGQGKRKLRLV